MSTREKVKNALTAVFPDIESVTTFIEDSESRRGLQSFIELAARHNLVETPDSDAFNKFILANQRPLIDENRGALTMKELIENKKRYLKIKISNRALTDKINLLLSKNSVSLPPLSSAMLTRLKKQAADTPRKRDALRSFAFWIGFERSEMGKEWHYETLRRFCRDEDRKTANSAFGVRIAFSINSRGNTIGREIMLWLKKNIKKILFERANRYTGKIPLKVKNYDLSTFYVDIPNQDAGTIPGAYGHALKEAISIAHRVSILWMISGFANYSRSFFVGINTGDFSEINNSLQAALNAKLTDDPVIRLTDYARQCVMINELKIILNQTPKVLELVNNESTKIWWVKELSSTIYWDLTPEILNDSYLRQDISGYLQLKRQLMFQSTPSIQSVKDDAVSYFLNFPHHSMLGFEIVRVLFCKKRLMEAMEILNVLLKINPDHISSRVMRMMIYKNFGLEALNYRICHMMFRRAEKEAQYITTNFKHTDEDFYYEYAVLKLARLSVAVRALRKHPDGVVARDLKIVAADLLAVVDEAEEILMQGITVSLTVQRLFYLFYTVHVLKIVLAENIDDSGRLDIRLTCPKTKLKPYLLEVLLSGGQHQKLSKGIPDIGRFFQLIRHVLQHYTGLVALEIFKPALYFSSAIIFWDLMPVRNVASVLSTLQELKNAIRAAKKHALKKEFIFSNLSMAGQIIPAEEFIVQVCAIIKEIEKRYKKASELEQMDPAREIESDQDDLVLMTYHL